MAGMGARYITGRINKPPSQPGRPNCMEIRYKSTMLRIAKMKHNIKELSSFKPKITKKSAFNKVHKVDELADENTPGEIPHVPFCTRFLANAI
jgi:hypothetical protein